MRQDSIDGDYEEDGEGDDGGAGGGMDVEGCGTDETLELTLDETALDVRALYERYLGLVHEVRKTYEHAYHATCFGCNEARLHVLRRDARSGMPVVVQAWPVSFTCIVYDACGE